MSTLPLDEHRLHLWYARPNEITDPALLDEYRDLLSPGELQQQARFKFDKDRHQYLVSRALVRTALSAYTGKEPGSWEFLLNAFGKPMLAGNSPMPLEFNLSHTPGLVTCLVALGHEVGVDTEDVTRQVDYLPLARRFFAAGEIAVLEGLPPEQQPAAFFRLWTLKEAYTKACGLGLSIPLEDFAFRLAADRPPEISFADRAGDDPDCWQFAEVGLGGRYQVALAVRAPAAEPFSWTAWEAVPLGDPPRGGQLEPNPARRWEI